MIGAQAEAEAYKLQAFAEAEEMRAKGYTYQQETARMVGMEAMQNGITGGEGGAGAGALGDVAGLGVALGAMGGVIGLTKDALNPIVSNTTNIGASVVAGATDSWDCSCGARGITTRFCPDCGARRPEAAAGWDCACGTRGITTRFCPNCGTRRAEPDAWDCSCGRRGITTNFCPECGNRRGE